MARRSVWQYALIFLTFLSVALAASPTSFCKCTCFTNSTIIPLDDSPTTSGKPASNDADTSKSHHQRTCNDCTKQFCLDYHLPICQDAKETDVFTTCFQRDSAKDETVVFIFIFATGGLLIWAAIRPWVQKWRNQRATRDMYAPVGARDNGQ
ncbi:hypothetical protein NU195Hw_g5772t1 [Hortaea werneckii]